HAHRRLVLRVAQGGDIDAEPAGGVEDRRAGRDRGLAPVDRELHRACGTHHTPIGQTLAGQRWWSRCSSSSSRKWSSTDLIGTGTTWPSPQIDACMSVYDRSSIIAVCSGRPRPWAISFSTSTILAEPTRQGTHLPHDSFLKKRTALSAMSSMQAWSLHTTMA